MCWWLMPHSAHFSIAVFFVFIIGSRHPMAYVEWLECGVVGRRAAGLISGRFTHYLQLSGGIACAALITFVWENYETKARTNEINKNVTKDRYGLYHSHFRLRDWLRTEPGALIAFDDRFSVNKSKQWQPVIHWYCRFIAQRRAFAVHAVIGSIRKLCGN